MTSAQNRDLADAVEPASNADEGARTTATACENLDGPRPDGHSGGSGRLLREDAPQRAWGFFAFATCTVALALAATQREDSREHESTSVVVPLPVAAADEPEPVSSVVTVRGGPDERAPSRAAMTNAELAEPKIPAAAAVTRNSVAAPSHLSVITFETASVVTTEKAVAAVFLVKRSQPLNRRVLVQWTSRSGSADAAIDFSDASGTAVFADGQDQVAVYVPLRNDLLKERDEIFQVCLHSPLQGKLGH